MHDDTEAAKDLARRRRQTPRSRTTPKARPPAHVEKCPATSKRTGKPCGAIAGKGTGDLYVGVPGALCRHHGGMAPSGQRHNARKRWEYLTARAEATYDAGFDIPDSPEELLLQECERSARAVAWLQMRVAEIDERDLTDKSRPGNAQAATLHEMYMRERAHGTKVAETAVRCGVKLKTVELKQAQGRLVAEVMLAAINDPAVPLDSLGRRQLRQVFARHVVRALPAGANTNAIDVESEEDGDEDD